MLGHGEDKDCRRGTPSPAPAGAGTGPGCVLAAAGGLGEGGFQRSSSQGHICCMCLKQLIKVPERPKK